MSGPTVIALVFAESDKSPSATIYVEHNGTTYTVEGLRKSGLLAVGPMEAIVMNQLADKMRMLALKLDARIGERGGVR